MLVLLPFDMINMPLNMTLMDYWILAGLPVFWLSFFRKKQIVNLTFMVPMWHILLGSRVSIKPEAWQIEIGYQFYLNPWVEEIDAQGTYLAFGYSESRDLGGVMQAKNDELTRVGFVPRRRFLVTAGEWVLERVRFSPEYSYNVDYPKDQNGTGSSANAIFSAITLVL